MRIVFFGSLAALAAVAVVASVSPGRPSMRPVLAPEPQPRAATAIATRRLCPAGDVVTHGLRDDLPVPRAMLGERLPASLCVGAHAVDIESYLACAASGACAPPVERSGDDAYLGPASPVRGVPARDAAAYCRQRGQSVATPAQILAGIDARTLDPDRYGHCVDECGREDDVPEATSTETFRCAGPPGRRSPDRGP